MPEVPRFGITELLLLLLVLATGGVLRGGYLLIENGYSR